METERLNICLATTDEMREIMDAQTDLALKRAYGEMLQGCLDHPELRPWYGVWKIDRKNGTRVGDLSFKGFPPDGGVEIGYGILEAHRNRGYATEAVKAAVAWALDQPGVTRVEAETEPDNAASRRVLEKCGFRPTGMMGEEGPRFVTDATALGIEAGIERR
jgi:ribosomal-protein-alanine N-acetyltransferase